MMVTITSFAKMATDANGGVLPLGEGGVCEKRTTAGNFAAVSGFIRVATDTAVTLTTASGDPELFMPGVEFRKVSAAQVLALAVV